MHTNIQTGYKQKLLALLFGTALVHFQNRLSDVQGSGAK